MKNISTNPILHFYFLTDQNGLLYDDDGDDDAAYRIYI